MAAIDYETAKRLAKQIVASGNSEGVPIDQLIKNIMRQPEEGQGVAPQGAIASALMLQPPQTITPASPAPMQPGVALTAPKPTAQMIPAIGGGRELLPEDVRLAAVQQEPGIAEIFPAQAAPAVEEVAPVTIDEVVGAPKEGVRRSRYRDLLDQTLSELNSREQGVLAAQQQGVPVPLTEQARIRALTDRATMLKGYIQAEESAEVPEELRKVLDRQEGRFARQEELLREAKSRAPWEALAQASFALGQGRKGERFSEALSRGLQAGLQSYGKARQENIEGVESLEESKDAAIAKRYELLQKARDDAIRLIQSGQTMDKDIAEVAKMTDETVLRTALMGPTIRKGEAEAGMAEFELGAAPQKLASELAVAGERAGAYRRSGTGKTGGDGIKGAATLLASFDRDAKIYSDIIKDVYASDADKAEARRNLADVNLKRLALRSAMMGDKVPVPSAKTGANKPDFVYVPGKGMQPAK